jgi:hypothetical protein
MAHPYTTRARLDTLIRPTRLVRLLDIDQDGLEDSGVFAATIERAANLVDSDLARVYVVPFDAVSASPATPGIISDLTDYASAVELFREGGAPNSSDADYFQAKYDALMNDIRAGRRAVPGATPVAASGGIVAAVFDSEDPVFAGVDSSSVRRSSGLF